MRAHDLLYDGTTLNWLGVGSFKATSGLPGHQNASEQSHKDEGPVPEGFYSFPLTFAPDGKLISEKGQLDYHEGIQHLPDHWDFHGKRYNNVAWGADRVRLTIHHIEDPKSRSRGGFYLHDSTKGYSHGCIEVQPVFFQKLRDFAKLPLEKRGKKKRLYLKVKYPSSTASTYGATDK